MRRSRWTKEKAARWALNQPWWVGCNFTPSTACNQLEMWQAETFDPDTIARELGWAADIGMNSVRVFLHDLVWQADAEGFKSRIEHFLRLADAVGIQTMLVLFDDCWFPPKTGPQEEPVPGVHNSRWAQSPGHDVVRDRSQWPRRSIRSRCDRYFRSRPARLRLGSTTGGQRGTPVGVTARLSRHTGRDGALVGHFVMRALPATGAVGL